MRDTFFIYFLCFSCVLKSQGLPFLIVSFSLRFFLAPHKKEAKKLSGSTYVFGVRSRSSVSLAVVSATTTKMTRPRVKTRFSSFAQTIDTMHSLRRVAYFASDSLMNPNPLRSFLSEKEVHSISQSIVVFPADLK